MTTIIWIKEISFSYQTAKCQIVNTYTCKTKLHHTSSVFNFNTTKSIAISVESQPFHIIASMAPVTSEHGYDRLSEVKKFDESKIGVKGLVDSGVTTIPSFFHQPPENLPGPKPKNRPKLTVPVIDLSAERSTVVEEIRRSASTLGFFQIVNHSIPTTLIDSVLNGLKSFFEQPTEYKMQFYHREAGKGAAYSTNFDLYQSKAASWRDTLQVRSKRFLQ